ncbi:H-type small acid-soluble spore protein [Pontibacillus litoralis]|uniref:SASP H n=1 Tax=Pontibacillus litoralis JSM 072002 TaxID=1385512 RepID=A0A0A5HR75_9BACI|nr:H-type small acid-soluble spore protein [Pontibacillus litoralis]KGX86127.1 hypothetical protein N784_06065 [Pontibacillus litoralis JSM 072002]
MNKQRATEIAQSPIMANVSYNGMPIYIQHVDEHNDTARISNPAHISWISRTFPEFRAHFPNSAHIS